MPDATPGNPYAGFASGTAGQNAENLSEDALNESLNTYSQAAGKLDYYQGEYDRLRSDPKSDATRLQDASNQADNARKELGAAARAHSTLIGRLALSYDANLRAAKDPAQQALWAAESEKAKSQSDLYKEEAALYESKTADEVATHKTQAAAALQRAQTASARSVSLGNKDAASTALTNAKLAALPDLTQSTINLHNQQIQTAAAHATLYGAQAAKTDAQTQFLIPAQADKLVADGVLKQAEADQLKKIGPVRVDELEAKLGLETTKADLIRSQIGKQIALPGADRTLPTVAEFQPSTGQITGVDNPAYVVPELQAIKDWSSSVQKVQDMLANGQLGDPSNPDAQDQATQLIQNLYTSLSAKSKGLTPDQYYNQQQSQANLGRGLMGDIIGRGQTAADQFLGAAKGARGLGGMSFSPYSSMFQGMGGNDMMQQAMGLISQVKPVTDRASAFDALSKYAAVKHIAQSVSSPTSGADQGDQSVSPTGGESQPTPSDQPQAPTPFAQSDIPEGSSRR